MKKKIILIIIVAIFITIIIYTISRNDKKIFLALGDSIALGKLSNEEINYSFNDYIANYMNKRDILNKFNKDFTESGMRTTDLINMIRNNERNENNNITIQQALAKADYITISIGSYDLFNRLGITNGGERARNNYELNRYFLSKFTDLNELLKLIKKYTTARVVVIGFYNPVIDPDDELVEIFKFIDEAYRIIAQRNNCEYVSLEKINSNEEYISDTRNTLINAKAHEFIGQMIIELLKF